MFHDIIGPLGWFIPLFLVLCILLLTSRLWGGSFNKRVDKKMEEAQQRLTLLRQETAEFQQQLLAELRRHNAVMEQQSELLARLLERTGQ